MSEMVGHQRREDSPVARDISMSPSSRRRADFTLRQLQNDVMFRARSTLSSLGDAMWRPSTSKASGKPAHKHRSTLDFFMCARHKKIDHKDKAPPEVSRRPRGKFTRNKSLDCEGGENVPLRRDDLSLSLGEDLNWIPEEAQETSPKARPSSYHDGNVAVKARLKLQKFVSHDESAFVPTKSPKIIRQCSHDPRSQTITEEKAQETHNLAPQKPRKKLSFREPENDAFIMRSNSLDSELESQAMRIVRTVGQAFEVCHNRKVATQNTKVVALDRVEDGGSETPCDTSEQDRCSEPLTDDEEPRKEIIPITPEPVLARPNHLDILSQVNYDSRKSPQEEDRAVSPLPAAREVQKLKEQLEQQSLQTRQALAQLMLVREQLISETNARVEAQARTQQLLQQNRELLEHIAALGGFHEPDRPSLTAATLGIAPQLSSTAKVARWFSQLPWHQASLSRPESGFVSGDSRSEKNILGEDNLDGGGAKEPDFCDEYLLVEGTANLWAKLSAKKRRKLLGLRLGKVTTF